MGGHIDSWDTGSQAGANDDGEDKLFWGRDSLKWKNLKPERTVRFLLHGGGGVGWTTNGALSIWVNIDNNYKIILSPLKQRVEVQNF